MYSYWPPPIYIYKYILLAAISAKMQNSSQELSIPVADNLYIEIIYVKSGSNDSSEVRYPTDV